MWVAGDSFWISLGSIHDSGRLLVHACFFIIVRLNLLSIGISFLTLLFEQRLYITYNYFEFLSIEREYMRVFS